MRTRRAMFHSKSKDQLYWASTLQTYYFVPLTRWCCDLQKDRLHISKYYPKVVPFLENFSFLIPLPVILSAKYLINRPTLLAFTCCRLVISKKTDYILANIIQKLSHFLENYSFLVPLPVILSSKISYLCKL